MSRLMNLLSLLLLSYSVCASTIHRPKEARKSPSPKVLILGGGVAGVIAARTLHENGIDNFTIIEARDELGGRLKSVKFAEFTVEVGANWVQGTQTGNGPANPIYSLTQKHKVETSEFRNYFGRISESFIHVDAKSSLVGFHSDL